MAEIVPPDETFGIRAREILRRGREAIRPLPDPQEVEKMSPKDRYLFLDRVRTDLYALTSIVAEEALGRALSQRDRFPPYGLARSLFTDLGMLSAFPAPVAEGSLTDFRLLGKALIDTTVFHLDAHLKEVRKSESAWRLEELARLLALFRLGVDSRSRARMRDSFSFIYGGLQFGTSTCIQLAEVMARLLRSVPELDRRQKAEIMKRSIRPAYDLASINVADVAPAYAKLQPAEAGAGAGSAENPAGWMGPEKFSLRKADGNPSRITLEEDLRPGNPEESEGGVRFTTHGCPARVSPAGTRSPIGQLWEWSVDLADQTGLLDVETNQQPGTA